MESAGPLSLHRSSGNLVSRVSRGVVEKPKDIKGSAVLYRRQVVERNLAWMSRRRRLAKGCGSGLASSLAWRLLAASRFLIRRVSRAANQ